MLNSTQKSNKDFPITYAKTSTFKTISVTDKLRAKRFKVDTLTGEILSSECILKEQKEAQDLLPMQIRNTTQVEKFLEHGEFGITTLHTEVLERYHQESITDKVLRNGKQMTRIQHEGLRLLLPLIFHANLILVTRKELIETLKTDDKTVIRKLKQLQPYIQYQVKGIRMGEIKIKIHPLLAFKHTKEGNELLEVYLRDYLKGSNNEGDLGVEL